MESLYILWAAFEVQSIYLLLQSIFLLLLTLSLEVPKHVQIGHLNLSNAISKALNWAVFIVVIPYLLVSYVPALEKAHLPLVPDVRLSVVSAQTSQTFATSQASSGRAYLSVTVHVRSVWNAWGIKTSPYNFELIAGEVLDTDWRFRPGECGATVPINGSVTCTLIFEVPDSLNAGTLRFDTFEYADEVVVNF